MTIPESSVGAGLVLAFQLSIKSLLAGACVMGVDVFISYVEEDSSVAMQLGDGLRRNGFSTWLYERDILPGVSYLVQTGDAIAACRAFLLLITPHSIGSHQVGAEVVRAFEEDKPFFPLRQDVSHKDLQRRQPAWRQAIGSSASIAMDSGDIDATVRRVAAGLQSHAILPGRADEPEQTQSPLTVGHLAKYEVFISAHSSHQELVGRLVADLGTFGITAFFPSVLGGASDFLHHIDEALDSAKVLVVVLGTSPEEIESSWSNYEWHSFINEIHSGRKQDGAVISLLLNLAPERLPLVLGVYQSLQCDPAQPDEAFAALRKFIVAGRGMRTWSRLSETLESAPPARP